MAGFHRRHSSRSRYRRNAIQAARYLHPRDRSVGGPAVGAQSRADRPIGGSSDGACSMPWAVPHINSQSRTRVPRLPWYQWLGAAMAATRVIGTAEQERLLAALVAAGVKGHGHLAALLSAKLCSAIAFVPLCWLLLEWRHFFVGATHIRLHCWLALPSWAGVAPRSSSPGWQHGGECVSKPAYPTRSIYSSSAPKPGSAWITQSSRLAVFSVPPTPRSPKEFAATAAEMRVSAVRSQAFENLAQRAGLASLRGIVAALNQSIKFGTPLAGSLRAVAAEMRAERLVRFEERAARFPVLLTIPLMAFVLPSLMIVIGTPLALRITDMLARGP